ncbi:hypothetical protein KM043_013484 [Ampulex compressa]|nr:hypothetical protein KM043_013484 [Ampulex compressa]
MDLAKGKYTTPGGSKTWEYLATLTSAIMFFSIGAVVGWNSPTIVKLLEEDSPIPVTSTEISTLVAMMSFGHMIAPPINSLVVDRIGRKNTLFLSALPLLISWSLVTIATNVWILYVARFISGLSLGLVICVVPMYIGEIASPTTRGAGISVAAILYNIGILFTFVVVPYLSIQVMAGVLLTVVLAFGILFWFMPETPYYLIMRNRLDDAEAVLEKLRGKTDVSEELETMVGSMSSEENPQRKGGFRELFTVRANRRAFIIILLFTTTHHFGGFITILTYGQLILRETGNTMSDYTANVMLGIVQVISTILTGFLVDKLGRRPLVLASGSITAACNLVIGVFFLLKEYMDKDVSGYSWAPFVSCLVMIFAFNCGLMCLQITMLSEIFATEVKAIGTCLIGIFGGLLATLGVKFYILIAITWGCGHSPPFLGFCALVTFCTCSILYLLPETKGKTFAQIQKELSE